ncbi:MAG: hypothetical protein WCH86_04945, partial [Kiritimatiellales bacterium]
MGAEISDAGREDGQDGKDQQDEVSFDVRQSLLTRNEAGSICHKLGERKNQNGLDPNGPCSLKRKQQAKCKWRGG